MADLRALIVKFKRALKRMWYQDIWNFWPSLPFSWRYFLPNQSAQIQLHRHLWWYSRYKLPGIFWLPLELIRWTYWRLWVARRQVNKAVARNGTDVAERFGIPIDDQRNQLAFWANAWCIDPYTAYNWQLFRPGADGLKIIFENETSAFHAFQNKITGATKSDHRLLGDKIKLAEKLSVLGIPMVETAIVSSGDWQDLLGALTKHSRLFCKLRSGNRGESAFAVWQEEKGIQGLGHDGKILDDQSAVQSAWRELAAKGAVLIQPLLQNHPDIATAGAENGTVTIRVITQTSAHGIQLLCASLEVPTEKEKASDARGYCIFPIDNESGRCELFADSEWLDTKYLIENQQIFQKLAHGGAVPYWQELQAFSLLAHSALPKVWAIAWDWVVTPTGPVLLEGNSGWGMDTSQMQLGGFNPP